MPVEDPEKGELTVDMELKGANFALAEYRFPVDTLKAKILLANDQLVLHSMTVRAMDGRASASGVLGLGESLPLKMELILRGMKMENTLRVPGRYVGVMDADVRVVVPLDTLTETIDGTAAESLPPDWGTGRLELSNAKLVQLPVIDRITRAIRKTSASITGNRSPPKDRLRLEWAFKEKLFDFSEIIYVGDMVAARGKGTMDMSGEMNLSLNAGPLEKMQSMLGPIGELWGKFSDSLSRYDVTGPVSDPKISLKVGGH